MWSTLPVSKFKNLSLLLIILICLFSFAVSSSKDPLANAATKPLHSRSVSPRNYYFPLYDALITQSADWLLIWNPDVVATMVTVSIGGATGSQNGSTNANLGPQSSLIIQYPGLSAGPVVVTSQQGTPLLVSQRTLTGGTFEEVNAIPETNLDSHYFYTWYDSVTMKTDVYLANPNNQTVQVDASLAGNAPITLSIAPNKVISQVWPGKITGPLELSAHVVNNPNAPLPIVTTERASGNVGFNEIPGLAASRLASDYLWTWYDSNITNNADWLLLANPSPTSTIHLTIDIGNGSLTSSLDIAPKTTQFPSFPHLTTGPVRVKGVWVGTSAPANFLASQRTLTNGQFEELLGNPTANLSTDNYFTWFDSRITNNATWLLVANPNSSDTSVSIQIGENLLAGTLTTPLDGAISTVSAFAVKANQYALFQASNQQIGFVYIHSTLPVLISQRILEPIANGVSQFNETIAQNGAPQNALQIFPPNNPWNTDISTYAVDTANSQNYVNSIGANTNVHPDFGTVWNGAPNGIPFIYVNGNQAKVPVTFQYNNESDPGPYPIPPDAPIEGGPNGTGDRHVIVIDRSTNLLYETFSSYPHNGGQNWTTGSGAIFNLQSNALRPDGWTSADAAGLPIFPGLVKYDEAASGNINHALRFTVPNTQAGYIHPATHIASNDSNTALPPMGARFRLKQNYNISTFSPMNQAILRALKKYGMYVADNGSSWYISGAPDPRWNDDDLSNLGSIPGSAFEVVQTGPILH